MKFFKTTLSVLLLSSSFFSHAEMFSKEEYKKIEDSFIQYANDNGDTVFPFYVENFNSMTEQEIQLIKDNKVDAPPSIKYLSDLMLNGSADNRFQVLNYHNNVTAWVMAGQLKGQAFIDNKCTYLRFISTREDCLSVQPFIKENIKEVFTYNDIVIDEEYFADFFYVHELSHLIPSQRTFPEKIDVTKIWVENTPLQYREIYSDLFAIIYLNNILGYDPASINNIVLYRNFNLNSNDDLVHYSTPYIQRMLANEKWKTLTSFESIDSFIKDIYIDVNKDTIISKKTFSNIKAQNFVWCNDINFSQFKVREVLDKFVYHCKKLKNK